MLAETGQQPAVVPFAGLGTAKTLRSRDQVTSPPSPLVPQATLLSHFLMSPCTALGLQRPFHLRIAMAAGDIPIMPLATDVHRAMGNTPAAAHCIFGDNAPP